jgi:hypothetical protein
MKIVLSFYLIGQYGLVGMALAAAVPQMLLYVTIYPFFMARVLKLSQAQVMISSLSSGLLALFVSIPTALLIKYLIPIEGWMTFFVNIAIVTAVAAIPGWLIIDSEDRTLLKDIFKSKNSLNYTE